MLTSSGVPRLPAFVNGQIVVAKPLLSSTAVNNRKFPVDLVRFSHGVFAGQRHLHTFEAQPANLLVSPTARYLIWQRDDTRRYVTNIATGKTQMVSLPVNAGSGIRPDGFVGWSDSGDVALFRRSFDSGSYYVVHAPTGMAAEVPLPLRPSWLHPLAALWLSTSTPTVVGRVVLVYSIPSDAVPSILSHWQVKKTRDPSHPFPAWHFAFTLHDVALRGRLTVSEGRPIPVSTFDAMAGKGLRALVTRWLKEVVSHERLFDKWPDNLVINRLSGGAANVPSAFERAFFVGSDYDSPQGTGLYADSLVYYASVANRQYRRAFRLEQLGWSTWSSVDAHRVHFLDHDSHWNWLDVRTGEFYEVDLTEHFTPLQLLP